MRRGKNLPCTGDNFCVTTIVLKTRFTGVVMRQREAAGTSGDTAEGRVRSSVCRHYLS